MRRSTGLLLLSSTIFLIALFCYFYEQRYSGLLPVITYPYRDYALPLVTLGATIFIFGLYLRAEKEPSPQALSSATLNLAFFIAIGLLMKIVSEILHEIGGHGFYVLLFGGRILGVQISPLWPLQSSHIWWSLPALGPLEKAFVVGGGILNGSVVSFVLQLLLFFRPQSWHLGAPLLWLAYWSYISSAGYLLSGGFGPFGDVPELIAKGSLTRTSSFLLGLAVFTAGYVLLSLILRRLLKTHVTSNNLGYIVAGFWLTTTLVAILAVLNHEVKAPPSIIPVSFIPALLWLVLELLRKRQFHN